MAKVIQARTFAKLEGVQQVKDALNETITFTQARALKAVYTKAGEMLEAQVRADAPYLANASRYGKVGKKKPWIHTRDAIALLGANTSDPNVWLRINRHSAPQAYWYEYGTSKQPPRPFFFPAIKKQRAAIKAVISAGVLEAITNPQNFTKVRAWR